MNQPGHTQTSLAGSPISGWRAIGRVITDPAETFRRLGPRPPILPPYLFQTIIGLLVFVAILPAMSATFDQTMAAAPAQPGAEQMTEGMMGAVKWVSIATAGLTVLAGPWLAGLLVALLALFLGQFQGGGVPFSTYFSMAGYARIPLALSTLIGGVYQALTHQQLNLSLAVILPEGAGKFMVALLQVINPFGLWYYALLALGFATLFGRPPRKGWLLPALLAVGGVLATMATLAFAPKQ